MDLTANIIEGHGVLFLIGLALFPRITLLFFAATPFGWLAWLGIRASSARGDA